MKTQRNRRGHVHHVYESQHLKLNDLKEKARHLENRYLSNEHIPVFPRTEFHVSYLNHDTERDGLRGIGRDFGFRNPHRGSLQWWSLAVGHPEIMSAERRLLETTYPDRSEEQTQTQQSFLWKFTTSPAFTSLSRLGSYRFTFPVEELLQAYRQQFCSGAPPVMRIFRTYLYKQKVMYAVLVHSPDNDELFSDRPLLTDDPDAVCSYRDNCFIWRPEAMSGEHKYRLRLRPDKKQMEAEEFYLRHNYRYYVWDQVAVAFHVDKQVLKFDASRLRENLRYCERDKPPITTVDRFDDFQYAQLLVKALWPDYPSPLERAEGLD